MHTARARVSVPSSSRGPALVTSSAISPPTSYHDDDDDAAAAAAHTAPWYLPPTSRPAPLSLRAQGVFVQTEPALSIDSK